MSVVKIDVPLYIQPRNKEDYSYFTNFSSEIPEKYRMQTDDDLPYLQIVSACKEYSYRLNYEDYLNVAKCDTLIYCYKMLDLMSENASLLTATTICMQMFEIKRLLSVDKAFTDSLTDSVTKFVLYNNLNRHHLPEFRNSGNVMVEQLADLGLVIEFAIGKFPKKRCFG